MSGHLIDLYGWSGALASFVLWLLSLPFELLNWIALQTGAQKPGPLVGFIDWLAGPDLTALVALIVAITIVLLWATAFHLLIIMWIERKMYSRLQDRRGIMIGLGSVEILRNTIGRIPILGAPFRRPSHLGTGFLQTVADGVKLFQKEVITPEKADKWMFHTAPVIIAASTLLLFVAIPWSDGFWLMGSIENGRPVNPLGILFILAAFSIAPLGILIAGWASNNKYTLIGGMRAAAQLMSYEIPMLLCIIALVVFAGTLDPFELVRKQTAPFSLGPVQISFLPNWYVFNPFLWIAFVVVFVTVIAEAERIPFDIPEAEAELVEGWTTEYSGMRFGIVFGFKWLRALAGAALISILFLGGWSGPVFATFMVPNMAAAGQMYPVPILPQEFWFTLRIYLIFVVFVWIGWSVPRVRIDQILNIGWKRLVPLSLLSILLAALARGAWWS
ncbi:MAG: NADH-quinone oxidoreductase subunit H [Euryarchaeota archaeon]|nr:NADH-quinone oxidoreductase subunit H [Euryarchaeota archaeon]